MIVHRLCRARFRALDGDGARQYGGRWNSPGRPVLYTASTLSLAALEYLVHLNVADAPNDLVALEIELPGALAIERLDTRDLPIGWHTGPDVVECRAHGDRWLAAQSSPILAVPAAPVPSEWNYLINPAHPACSGVVVVRDAPFHFDPRLVS